MKIEKKYMDKRGWKRVIQRKYISKKIIENGRSGEISLVLIEKVTEPSIKQYENGIKVKIADNNYYWLQLAFQNENYWITAMFDDKKQLIQYYIDITEKNEIKNNGESYFLDLFLDIVILQNGDVLLLDEEELTKALEEKNITIEQYDLAYNTVKKIMKKISKERNKLDLFFKSNLEMMLKNKY